MIETDKNEAGAVTSISAKPPTQDPCHEDVVQETAKLLNKMSLREREEILFDLHGISEKVDEASSAEFIAHRLALLQEALDKKIYNKGAYGQALKMDPAYVNNREYRLLFLRADLFDPYKAASRLMRHMETKKELFGEELLCKDITQDDLDEGTRKLLYSGMWQELPLRDSSGRTVSITFTKMRHFEATCEQKLRRLFYTTMALVEDEETQKNGRIIIIWGSNQAPERGAAWKLCKILSSLPLRICASHICLQPEDTQINAQIYALAQFALEAVARVRIRTHVGTVMEVKYMLQTFGIPVSTMPITDEGEVVFNSNSEKWTNRRKIERARCNALESSSVSGDDASTTTTQKVIYSPRNSDVLFGRGQAYQNHPGNIRFRSLIDEHRDAYEQASRKEKTKVAVEIIRLLHDRNGRFLKEDGAEAWIEVDGVAARQKVSSCFRSFRKLEKIPSHDPIDSLLKKRTLKDLDNDGFKYINLEPLPLTPLDFY